MVQAAEVMPEPGRLAFRALFALQAVQRLADCGDVAIARRPDVLGTDLLEEFLAMNRYRSGSFNAQSHLIAANLDYEDLDIIVYNDRLSDLPS